MSDDVYFSMTEADWLTTSLKMFASDILEGVVLSTFFLGSSFLLLKIEKSSNLKVLKKAFLIPFIAVTISSLASTLYFYFYRPYI